MGRAVRAASVWAKQTPRAVGMQGPGKKWEHLETNHNSKVVRQPIHVRKGDTVQVIAGKDKGKIGEISQVRLRLELFVLLLPVLWLACVVKQLWQCAAA